MPMQLYVDWEETIFPPSSGVSGKKLKNSRKILKNPLRLHFPRIPLSNGFPQGEISPSIIGWLGGHVTG